MPLWLALKFLPRTTPSPTGAGAETPASAPAHLSGEMDWGDGAEEDAPQLAKCGAIMTRSGAQATRCANCGST